MASMRKKNGSWEVRYKVKNADGKWKDRSKSFKNRTNAKQFLLKMEVESLETPIIDKKKPKTSELTFKDFVDIYIADYGKENWKLANFFNNVSFINYYILPYFSDYLIKDIDLSTLKNYFRDVLKMDMKGRPGCKTKRKVTLSRRTEIKKRLLSMFNYAVENEIIDTNPVMKIKLKKTVKKQIEDDNIPCWKQNEMIEALTVCKNRQLRLAMMISYTCSLRIGEASGLTWNHVVFHDEEHGPHLEIFQQLQRINREALTDPILKEDIITVFEKGHDTKTVSALVSLKTESSYRRVPLSTELISLLKEEKKHQEEIKKYLGSEYKDYNLVIAQENGCECNRKYLNKHLKKLIKENNLKNITYHSIRHSSATTLLRLTGNDIKKVQKILGQSRAETKLLMNTYAHEFKSNKDIRKSWDNLFGKEHNENSIN